MSDDLRRRMLQRQLQSAQPKNETPAPAPAVQDLRKQAALRKLQAQAQPTLEDPDRVVSVETEARLREAQATASRLAKAGAAATVHAARSVGEKASGVRMRPAYLVTGVVVVALAAGGWWWFQREPAKAEAPTSAVTPAASAPQETAEPAASAPQAPESTTEAPAQVAPLPTMAPMPTAGRFDPAAVREQAAEERRREAEAKAQAEAEQQRQEQQRIENERKAREKEQARVREQEAARATAARAAPVVRKPQPQAPRPAVKPEPAKNSQLDDQLQQLDAWSKRLEAQQ